MKMKCVNNECINYNKPIDIDMAIFPYITERERLKKISCNSCKEKLLLVVDKDKPSFNYNKFNQLSDKEKKNILKLRATENYKKSNGGELKNIQRNNLIKKMLKK